MVSHLLILTVTCLWTTVSALQQLPDDVLPQRYDLSITADIDQKTYTATVSIEILCKKGTDTVTLHAKDMGGTLVIDQDMVKITSVTNKAEISIQSKDFDVDNDFFIMKFGNSLESEKKYKLVIPFSGKIDGRVAGFMMFMETDEKTGSDLRFWATDFQKIFARRAFPCFDEPSLKAVFRIKLGIKESQLSISNTPLKSRTPIPDKSGWVWDEYVETPALSTFQVTYVVTEIPLELSIQKKTNVNFYFREDFRDVGHTVREVANLHLYKLTESYKMPDIFSSPLTKLDFLLLPETRMLDTDHWGIVISREQDFITDTENMDPVVFRIYEKLLSMWFGGLVTPSGWDSLWVFQSLTTYVAVLQMNLDYNNQEVTTRLEQWLELDSKKDTITLNDVMTNEGLTKESDTRRYKGLLLIRMLHFMMGQKAFRAVLYNFLNKYKYKAASANDLWEIIVNPPQISTGKKRKRVPKARGFPLPSGQTLQQVMSPWIEQPGYPVITVTRLDNGQVKVTQERFLGSYFEKQATQKADIQGCWWIPLTFATSDKKQFDNTVPSFWLGCEHKDTGLVIDTKASDQEWVIFNNRFTGLFRVNYDQKNWDLIIKDLNNPAEFKQIDGYCRGQLVNDALSLAWVGDLSYNVVFRLINYLPQERSPFVWRSFFRNAINLKTILKRTNQYDKFQACTKFLTTQQFNLRFPEEISITKFIDNDKNDKETELKVLLFQFSCSAGVDKCVQYSNSIFETWKSTGVIPQVNLFYPTSLVLTILCTTLRQGNDNQFQFVLNLLSKASADDVNRYAYLEVLRCTNKQQTILRLLDWTATATPGNVKPEEKQEVFMSLARGRLSFVHAINYFYKNIQKIKKFFGNTEVIAKYIQTLAAEMNKTQLDQLRNFIKNSKELQAMRVEATNAFDEGREVGARKFNWLDKNFASVSEALKFCQARP